MSFVGSIVRLSDPFNHSTSPRQLKENQEKISACMTRMFRQSSNGGNPFLFSLTSPKPHEITNEIPTAATDGKKFYWNPEWLEQMDQDQVSTVMMHEAYHVLFFHTSKSRSGGLDHKVWNIAIDYIVNATIMVDHEKQGRNAKLPTEKLFGGVLGTPVPLKNYLEWFDGTRLTLPDPGCYADITIHGRSPESIYEEIQKAAINSPRRCKEQSGGCGALTLDPKTGISTLGPGPYKPECCQKCGAEPNSSHGYGGSLDSHMPSQQTKDEILGDMMRAAEQARAMGRGTVPGDIESALGRMAEPELSASDIIRSALARKKQDAGNINDWKRFRRRPEYIYVKNADGQYEPQHRLYTPKKHDFTAQVCVMIDTSGSMSDEDIACGIKELKAIAHVAEIHVTPNDVVPHWDKTVKVTSKAELKNVRIVGRSGTDYQRYFEELPGQPWYKGTDLVIIISDGDVNHVPMELLPRTSDLLWIMTNKREFKPNGGRVVNLRPSHA